MRVAIECAGFTPGEADQLRRVDGDLQVHRRRLALPRQARRRHGRQRLRARLRRADLQAARRLRQLWLPREPRRLLRADRLCLVLAEVLASGRVLRGAAQRPADGLLRAGADRARRRRRMASRSGRSASTPRAGTARWSRPTTTGRFAVRLGLRMVRGLANAHAAAIVAARADRAVRLGRRPLAPRRRCRRPRSSGSPRPTPSGPRFGLARREALWAIKALRDEPLPLFAAAAAREARDRAGGRRAGRRAPADDRRRRGRRGLRPCRPDAARSIRSPSCATICGAGGSSPAPRRWRPATAAGSRPPASCWSASGRARPRACMFITLEDETGIANLVVWPKVFEQTPPRHPVRQHDGGARPHPARGRGGPSRRPAARRSLGRSRQRRRARGRLPAAAWPRRPGPRRRLRPRSARSPAQGLPRARPRRSLRSHRRASR